MAYSSMSPARAEDCANQAPPQARISPPDWFLRADISSDSDSLAIGDSGQVASVSVLERTTCGAHSSGPVGQRGNLARVQLRLIGSR